MMWKFHESNSEFLNGFLKFYRTPHLPEGEFPYWTKSRLAGFGPPKPLKPKDPILDRLNDDSRYISDEEMIRWMKPRFNQ